MSYEDLEEHNIFLPEEHWDELELSSSVNQPLLLFAMVVGIASCVLMVIGAGNTFTWLGSGLFIIFLILFTILSKKGIDNQNEKVNKMMD